MKIEYPNGDKVDTAVETCGGCGHAPHWRECRGKTIGAISGDPIACECRHRGPSGTTNAIQERLDALRAAIEAEDISYGEIVELQSLAEHIDPSDAVLLQWAGVPEFPEDGQDRESYSDTQDRESYA